MYVATNRFSVNEGREEDFENIWRNRESFLDEVDGFTKFSLLRSELKDGVTLFVSNSIWESKDAFDAWRNSESFKKAHSGARTPEGTLTGHPKFEGFEVIIEE
ncbi:MAG: antibiotic biosynthesis monooxygenase [Candidatus Lindowbacteria bacterium]|nr:antibiotic biosynthesis monooxygenase [Candidatus Lindowbacteria bacterium]